MAMFTSKTNYQTKFIQTIFLYQIGLNYQLAFKIQYFSVTTRTKKNYTTHKFHPKNKTNFQKNAANIKRNTGNKCAADAAAAADVRAAAAARVSALTLRRRAAGTMQAATAYTRSLYPELGGRRVVRRDAAAAKMVASRAADAVRATGTGEADRRPSYRKEMLRGIFGCVDFGCKMAGVKSV